MPTVAIVAGPNGSGKSTFAELFLKTVFPWFVNADEIAHDLVHIPESERSLIVARQADELREAMIEAGATFAFETVFSRTEHWVELMRGAKDRGYRIELSFLCTVDPVLNATRVQERVLRGGHAVPFDRVVARYARSIETALAARGIVDEWWLYDNTRRDRAPLLVARVEDGQVLYRAASLPGWAARFL